MAIPVFKKKLEEIIKLNRPDPPLGWVEYKFIDDPYWVSELSRVEHKPFDSDSIEDFFYGGPSGQRDSHIFKRLPDFVNDPFWAEFSRRINKEHGGTTRIYDRFFMSDVSKSLSELRESYTNAIQNLSDAYKLADSELSRVKERRRQAEKWLELLRAGYSEQDSSSSKEDKTVSTGDAPSPAGSGHMNQRWWKNKYLSAGLIGSAVLASLIGSYIIYRYLRGRKKKESTNRQNRDTTK